MEKIKSNKGRNGAGVKTDMRKYKGKIKERREIKKL